MVIDFLFVKSVDLFQDLPNLICRNASLRQIVGIKIPEHRVPLEILFDEKVFPIGTNDAVVKTRLPNRTLQHDSFRVDQSSDGGFE